MKDQTSSRVITTVDPEGITKVYHGLSFARAATEAAMEYFCGQAKLNDVNFLKPKTFVIICTDELGHRHEIECTPELTIKLGNLRGEGSND